MGLFFRKKKQKDLADRPAEQKERDIPAPEAPDERAEPFIRKARGTEIPKKAQRIFLCCTDGDELFREALIEDILSQDAGTDCVVTYSNSPAVPKTDDLQHELLESKVVVLAVTDAFLSLMEQGKRPEAFSFASDNGIPVLPVAADSGLLSRFNAAAGAVHVIAATDPEYRIKLKAQLDNFLVTQELYARITRDAFSANLFLSYRKKDLKEARVFMQRFHAIPGFETIAVWYDNYLTAGRIFDNEIKESIEKSDAFVLLVTDNLMEPDNYVLTTEYPYARNETHKKILAVEAVSTDRDAFDACYPAVDAYADLDGQEVMFRSALPEDSFSAGTVSEKCFLLGMAYLKAILVERNADIAIRFLSEAAAGPDLYALQASEQLAVVFEFGTVKPVDYDTALLWRERYLELCVELYGEDGLQTAAAYNNLGLVYEKLGRIEDAVAALRSDLSISLAVLGREHPETAVTYNNLGELLRKKGDLENAAGMAEEALKIRMLTLGENDPAVASSYNNLSAIYIQDGRLEQALVLARKAVEVLERTRGDKSTETAITYGNAASVLDELERYEEALPYAKKCVSIFENTLGPAHIDTAVAYKKLSRIYTSLSEYDQSYFYISKSLKAAEKVLGRDHRDMADYYGEMGDVLQMLHRYSEADEMYGKALTILDKAEYPPRELKAQLLTSRAMCRQSVGSYDSAVCLYHQALEYAEEALGKEHPTVGTICNDMGVLYRLTGQYEDAAAMYERALTIREKAYGNNSQTVSNTCNNMALVCQLMGKPDDALKLYQRSLSVDTALFGEDHPDIAVTYSNLALLYFTKQETEKALESARTSVRIAENGLEKGWPPMAVPYNTMAILFERTGRYSEALEYGLRAFHIWDKERPPDHPNLKSLFNTLGMAYTASGHTTGEFYEWADRNGLLC